MITNVTRYVSPRKLNVKHQENRTRILRMLCKFNLPGPQRKPLADSHLLKRNNFINSSGHVFCSSTKSHHVFNYKLNLVSSSSFVVKIDEPLTEEHINNLSPMQIHQIRKQNSWPIFLSWLGF